MLVALAYVVALTAALHAQPRPLSVAAASDLQGVLPDIARQFERQSGRAVRLTFGSSGNFFAQIQNGAPFDVYLSADIDYPRRLEQAGLVDPGSLHHYATGEIVLWTTKASGISLDAGLQALRSPGIRHIAIANPEHAPYGRAAVAALRRAGLYEAVQSKLVLGENISQAAQFVRAGSADVGIVARSISLIPNLAALGVSAPIPRESYEPIEQAGVIVRASREKGAAAEFMAFLKSPPIVALLQRFGFAAPTGGAR
jgi:molybdate transport system substrate-binding protein